MIQAPDSLQPDAKKWFEYFVKQLNITDEKYAPAIALGVKAYADYIQCEKELKGFTTFDKGNKTTRLNPIIRYQEKCWNSFNEFAKQFGLTPLYEKRINGAMDKNTKKKRNMNGSTILEYDAQGKPIRPGVPLRGTKPNLEIYSIKMKQYEKEMVEWELEVWW